MGLMNLALEHRTQNQPQADTREELRQIWIEQCYDNDGKAISSRASSPGISGSWGVELSTLVCSAILE
jgi:hypothetical protein